MSGAQRTWPQVLRPLVASKEDRMTASPIGLHRVMEPSGVLPQAAWRLDSRPQLWPDEVRIDVQTLNLDAASYRQLAGAHTRA
jgi:L-erythro-3,5-diaminohexanoate dehydrogenase